MSEKKKTLLQELLDYDPPVIYPEYGNSSLSVRVSKKPLDKELVKYLACAAEENENIFMHETDAIKGLIYSVRTVLASTGDGNSIDSYISGIIFKTVDLFSELYRQGYPFTHLKLIGKLSAIKGGYDSLEKRYEKELQEGCLSDEAHSSYMNGLYNSIYMVLTEIEDTSIQLK